MLLIKPEIFLFNVIEIKTYYKEPEKELDNCFPGNDFLKEDELFKTNIFAFLANNLDHFEENDFIIKGIRSIIQSLPPNSYQKKMLN